MVVRGIGSRKRGRRHVVDGPALDGVVRELSRCQVIRVAVLCRLHRPSAHHVQVVLVPRVVIGGRSLQVVLVRTVANPERLGIVALSRVPRTVRRRGREALAVAVVEYPRAQHLQVQPLRHRIVGKRRRLDTYLLVAVVALLHHRHRRSRRARIDIARVRLRGRIESGRVLHHRHQ